MKSLVTKITAFAVSVVLCLSAAGCFSVNGDTSSSVNNIDKNANNDNAYNKIANINTDTEYNEAILDYGYYSLETEAQKMLYKKFEGVANAVSDEKDDDGLYPMQIIEMKEVSLTEGNIRVVIEAFNCDHPEIFWISNIFGYYTDENVTMVHLYSEFSGKEINTMQSKLDNVINEFIKDIPKGLSEYEREKLAHDKLLTVCTYAENVNSSADDPNAFTMYGALVDKKAVCEGYTKSMQYLLKLLGIKTITVNGYSKNELHQWCIVNIDDNWYHLDPTWDDRDDEGGEIIYTYFNVTDAYITVDHTLAKKYSILTEEQLCGTDKNKNDLFNMPLPQCKSETASYYKVSGAEITSLENYDCYSAVVQKMKEAAIKQDSYFYIKISEDLDFNKTVDALFYQEPYSFFEYVTEVNKMLETDYKITDDSLSILTLDKQRIVQIQLKYQ